MFAGASIGLSGPEMLEYFSRFDTDIEQYPWSGGAPSRKQILQDCLARFTKEQQLDILVDMLRPENFQKYNAPHAEDQRFLREWVASQKHGTPPPPTTRTIPTMPPATTWDVFVSHASEDKATFAKPLAEALQARGVKVWFDAFTLTVGDSLRRSIDRGLAQSRFGIVVLSEAFFQKHWPQLELDGLVAREAAGVKVILPIWHAIDETRVRMHSPMLADRVAVSSAKGLGHVVEQLLQVIVPGQQHGAAA
jgi:TIR domain